MEHNIDVIEGTRFPLCVTLQDGEGNALAGDGFRVYGGAVCPGMGAVAFPVTRSGGDFVVMVPGLAVGRMPWRYQVFVVEQATGVEWLLCSGEVRPEARCADASGGVAAGSLTVTGVLDKQTLSLGVQLGESTELCRSLVARAEEAARRAEEAAAGASFTLTAEEVQKVVPMKWSAGGAMPVISGESALAIGESSTIEGNGVYNIVIGAYAATSGQESISVGKHAKTSKRGSMAFGMASSATNEGSLSVGSYSAASGYYSVVVGGSATASGYYGVTIGYMANTRDTQSLAIGREARTDSAGGVAVGASSWVCAYNGLALGYDSCASGEQAVAVGASTSTSGNYSMAVGCGAAADGDYSASLGCEARAKHDSAVVLGIGAESTAAGELLLSACNREEGTRVSLELVAGKATGGNEDMWSPARFMDDTKVKLTVRDELSGLQHSVAVSLSLLMYHLKNELQGVSEFGVVEGDGYGY